MPDILQIWLPRSRLIETAPAVCPVPGPVMRWPDVSDQRPWTGCLGPTKTTATRGRQADLSCLC